VLLALLLTAAALLATLSFCAPAQDWNGSASNLWSAAGNWTPNTVPNSSTAAVTIGNTTNNPVLISGINPTIGTLTLGNSTNSLRVQSSQTLTVDGGSISNAGSITLQSSGTLALGSSFDALRHGHGERRDRLHYIRFRLPRLRHHSTGGTTQVDGHIDLLLPCMSPKLYPTANSRIATQYGVPVEKLIEFNFPGSVKAGRVDPDIVNWYLFNHQRIRCRDITRNGYNYMFRGGEKIAVPYLGRVDVGEPVILAPTNTRFKIKQHANLNVSKIVAADFSIFQIWDQKAAKCSFYTYWAGGAQEPDPWFPIGDPRGTVERPSRHQAYGRQPVYRRDPLHHWGCR
jgi:hypothetical protein